MIDPRSNDHNVVYVNGIASPGRAQLTGVEAPFNWDVQTSYGREGAITIFKGRGIAKPVLTLTFWDPLHFVAWDLWKRLLEPPTRFKPLMISMRHPLLTSAGIEAVSVESIGEPVRQPNGFWIVTIKLIEYRPPKPALVKPRGAIPSPDKGVPIAPKTAADIALAKALDQNETLRATAR